MLQRVAHLLTASIILAAWMFLPSAAGETTKAESQVADIIALVRQRGWPSDLTRFCTALGLKLDGSQCLAQQVAFLADDRERAFNLIPLRPGAVSYIVIIDVEADNGVVYLASGSGELISTSNFSLGNASKQSSTNEAQEGYQRELAFWAANVGQFDKWLEKRKYGPVKPQ